MDTATVMGNVTEKDRNFPVRDVPVKDRLHIEKEDSELEMIARDGAKRDPSPAKTEKALCQSQTRGRKAAQMGQRLD